MEPSALAEDIRNNSRCWNLAGDGKILELMKIISKNLEERGNATNKSFNELIRNVNQVELSLENTSNKLSNLQNTQFIENRIDENSSSAPLNHVTAATTDDGKNSSDYDPVKILNEILKIGTATVEKYFEKTTVESDDSYDEEEESSNNIYYRRKKMYTGTPLTFLIGSKEWMEKSNVELSASDEEFSANEEEKDVYSSNSDNASLPSIAPTMSESESSIWGLQVNSISKRPPAESISSSEEISSHTYMSKNSLDEHHSTGKEPSFLPSIIQPLAPIDPPRYYVHQPKTRNLFDESSEEETEKESVKPQRISNIPTKKQSVHVNLFDEEPPELDEVDDSEQQQKEIPSHKPFNESEENNRLTKPNIVSQINENNRSVLKKPVNLFDDDDFDAFMKELDSKSNKKSQDTENATIKQCPEEQDEQIVKSAESKQVSHRAKTSQINIEKKQLNSDTGSRPIEKKLERTVPAPSTSSTTTKTKISLLFDDIPPEDDFDALFERPKSTNNAKSNLISRNSDQNHNAAGNAQSKSEGSMILKKTVNLFDDDDSDDDIFSNRSVNTLKPSSIHSNDANKNKKVIPESNQKDYEFPTKEDTTKPEKSAAVSSDASTNNKPSAATENENISTKKPKKSSNDLFADNLWDSDSDLFSTTSITVSKSKEKQQSSLTLPKLENLFSDEPPDDDFEHDLFNNSKKDSIMNNKASEIIAEKEGNIENSQKESILEQNLTTSTSISNSCEISTAKEDQKRVLENDKSQEQRDALSSAKDSTPDKTLPKTKEIVNLFDDKDVFNTTTSENKSDTKMSQNDLVDVKKTSISNQPQKEVTYDNEIIPNAISDHLSKEMKNEIFKKSELDSEQPEEYRAEKTTDEKAKSSLYNQSTSDADDFDWLFTNTKKTEEKQSSSPTDPVTNEEQSNNYTSSPYNPLTLFQDIPPDDDFQPSADNTKRLQNIFYDDFYETVSPKSQDTEVIEEPSISANYIFSDEPPPDNYEIEKSETLVKYSETGICDVPDDTGKCDDNVVDEINKTDEVVKEDALEISKSIPTKTRKLGANLNINVAALLPGARLPKSVKNDNEEMPPRLDLGEKILSHKTPLEMNNESQTERLHSLNKTRAKLQAKRKPSTRRARLANYEKSLDSDDAPFEERSKKSAVNSSESKTDEEITNNKGMKSKPEDAHSQIPTKSEGSETFIKEDIPRQVEEKQISTTSVKSTKVSSIFDDDEVSDDDLFGGSFNKIKTSTQIKPNAKPEIQIQNRKCDATQQEARNIEKNEPKIKKSLFSSDEDEDITDLFGKHSKNTSENSNQQKQKKQSENTIEKELKKPFKKNLFSSDDSLDDDDLFSNKSNKSGEVSKKQQNLRTSKLIASKKYTKSLFDSDENLTDDDLFATHPKQIKDNTKIVPKKIEPKPLTGKVEDNPLADLLKD